VERDDRTVGFIIPPPAQDPVAAHRHERVRAATATPQLPSVRIGTLRMEVRAAPAAVRAMAVSRAANMPCIPLPSARVRTSPFNQAKAPPPLPGDGRILGWEAQITKFQEKWLATI